MASDNLNRVFIKAYGKEKPRGGDQQLPGESVQPDSWIVRFDTATVQASLVPQMHNQRPPRHEAALVQPGRSPAPKSNRHRSLSAAVPIEDQMRSDLPERISEVPIEPAGTVLPPGIDLSELLGGTTVIIPQVGLNLKTQANSSSRKDESSSARPQTPESADIPGDIAQSERQSNSQVIAEKKQNEVQPRQQAIEGGQAASPATPSNRDQDRSVPIQSIDPIELDQQIAAKNKSGEIFRLDRPSYAAQQHPLDVFADDHASNPSESASLTAVNLANDFNQAQASSPMEGLKGPSRGRGDRSEQSTNFQPRVQKEQAKAKELDLRRATVRVFNPLWEVDRLEWPRVCLELLNAIDSKSPGIANNLLNACQDGLQVLAVTSPESGAGTSTVACCLAMIAGRHGLKIALVDGNMENPSLCYQTNLELEVDWHEAVARKLPLEEIAVHSVDDQVTLVPLLARLSAPQLNEQNIAKMLSELSQSFDLVVVDVGHMASSRNMVTALGDLGAINAVVAVVDRRNSSADRIESCLRQIRQTGIASIGLIENFAA